MSFLDDINKPYEHTAQIWKLLTVGSMLRWKKYNRISIRIWEADDYINEVVRIVMKY